MSDPTFLQFAENFRLGQFAADRIGAAVMTAEDLHVAERHARLLAAVWTWANDWPIGFVPYTDDVAAYAEYDAKVHVRALLAQTEEK